VADSVEIKGLARLQSSLGKLARQLPDIAPESAARIIGQAARLRAPKRTGRLASSWAADSGAGEQTLSFGAPHASPIHWGVGARAGLRGPHNIRPSLYLLRAVESTQALWVDEYRQEINDELGKVRGA
jgi:hypothetical protein